MDIQAFTQFGNTVTLSSSFVPLTISAAKPPNYSNY